MKHNRIIAIVMSIVLVLSLCFCIGVNTFADNIGYSYDEETKTLTITGTGKIANYEPDLLYLRPWALYSIEAETVIINQGITEIGDYAFARFSALSYVDIPDGVTRIGTAALSGNDNLKDITVPDSVTTFGTTSFGYNLKMDITDGFACRCGVKSEAQKYCLINHIPFDVPMLNNTAEAVITYGHEQVMWSFVAPTDGTLVFWSSNKCDTFGLLYDASNYIYSEDYSTMSSSAIAKNDDDGNNVGFKITKTVVAGKRYYLSAKVFSSTVVDENFDVYMSFACSEHRYEVSERIEPTCKKQGQIENKCIYCGDKYYEYIPKVAHTPKDAVKEITKAPSCTEQGEYYMVVYCSVCNEMLEKSQAYPIDALDHDYKAGDTYPSTCKEQGYTEYKCSRCESTYKDDYTPLAEHTRGQTQRKNVVQPDCVNAGSYDLVTYCSVCNAEIDSVPKVIVPLGHSYEIDSFDRIYLYCHCYRCQYEKAFDFMSRYNQTVSEDDEYAILDVNFDGVVNAKDYAMMNYYLILFPYE